MLGFHQSGNTAVHRVLWDPQVRALRWIFRLTVSKKAIKYCYQHFKASLLLLLCILSVSSVKLSQEFRRPLL